MEMPQVTDAHRKLEMFAGTWAGEETIAPTPWDAKGGTAMGRAVNRMAVGGFAMVQDYEQKRGGSISFTGHGVLRWDGVKKSYVMNWIDSMGMPPNEFSGQFEGNVLTMINRGPQGFSRAAWDFLEKGRYRFKMEVSPDGQAWHPFMEAVYARQA